MIVLVLWLFLAVPRVGQQCLAVPCVGQQCVIVVFPDQTPLAFFWDMSSFPRDELVGYRQPMSV